MSETYRDRPDVLCAHVQYLLQAAAQRGLLSNTEREIEITSKWEDA